MKLFIANASHTLEEGELQQLINHFGKVSSVKLLTNSITGKRKRFGFIEMTDEQQARRALTELNRREIKGRKITLKEATDTTRPAQKSYFSRARNQQAVRIQRDENGEINGKKGLNISRPF